jgi:hypothetical protein
MFISCSYICIHTHWNVPSKHILCTATAHPPTVGKVCKPEGGGGEQQLYTDYLDSVVIYMSMGKIFNY